MYKQVKECVSSVDSLPSPQSPTVALLVTAIMIDLSHLPLSFSKVLKNHWWENHQCVTIALANILVKVNARFVIEEDCSSNRKVFYKLHSTVVLMITFIAIDSLENPVVHL